MRLSEFGKADDPQPNSKIHSWDPIDAKHLFGESLCPVMTKAAFGVTTSDRIVSYEIMFDYTWYLPYIYTYMYT